MIDRNAILARLEVIADSLDLIDEHVADIAVSDRAIVEFASRHHQSIDWIVLGDVTTYIRQSWRNAVN